jgi:hypothetical protein
MKAHPSGAKARIFQGLNGTTKQVAEKLSFAQVFGKGTSLLVP